MVHIVTGKINSGKSTTLRKLYLKNNIGDGFISVKRMQQHIVHGYEIMKLSDQTMKPLVIREEFCTHKEKIVCQIGPYLFLEKTLKYIEQEIIKMIQSKTSPIYLDEIGQLELYDQCFHNIFSILTKSDSDIYVTVREDLVPQIIEKYQLKDVNIIKV
jgi:nucleoside-triphosphatase THEP1